VDLGQSLDWDLRGEVPGSSWISMFLQIVDYSWFIYIYKNKGTWFHCDHMSII
jgi:hypothetical protein